VRRAEADYQFIYTDDNGDVQTVLMTAIIESVDIIAQVGQYTEYDLSLVGTSGFSLSGSTDPGENACPSICLSDWWVTIPEQNYVDVGTVASARKRI